jgi:hypothetical protein
LVTHDTNPSYCPKKASLKPVETYVYRLSKYKYRITETWPGLNNDMLYVGF